MTIAEFLQQQIDAGLTRAELARRVGVHQSYITRWLSGTVPEYAQSCQIADGLGVPRVVVLRMAGREIEEGDREVVEPLGPAQAAALAVVYRIINGMPVDSLPNFAQAVEHLGRAFQVAGSGSSARMIEMRRNPEEHAGNEDGRDNVKEDVRAGDALARLGALYTSLLDRRGGAERRLVLA